MIKFRILILALLLLIIDSQAQTLKNIQVEGKITAVQPMTGIVLWNDNTDYNSTDAISLEFSYMKYNDIVKNKGVYDWTVMENLLNNIASRKHQAIVRFYFTYPKDLPLHDGKTTVPDYIKNSSGYVDFKGKGDGVECYFPDWRSTELQDFALEFYTKFAEKYDNDPRLAFVQTGFGLWAEYHAWSATFTYNSTTYKETKMIGIGFPSKDYQKTFLQRLNSVFVNTPWSISIDAADEDYTPMVSTPALKNLNFGLFDDSFMSEEHDSYNKLNWNFFGTERYKTTPCGGEFNYYTDADQKGVLNPTGWRGRTYETAASQFHISYMIGNDQPEYRSMERIKQASMASGYKFKVVSFKTSGSESKITIRNTGVAPIYHDAYVSVNNVRSSESLKSLFPNEEKEYTVYSGGDNPDFKIVCDRLVPGQTIQFEGNTTISSELQEITSKASVVVKSNSLYLSDIDCPATLKIITTNGKIVQTQSVQYGDETIEIKNLSQGIYFYSLYTYSGIHFSGKILIK